MISYTAWIGLDDGQLHGCILSDVSETGARIGVQDPNLIPDRFVLLLSNNGSARRTCDVVWRERHQIGVRFARLATAGRKIRLTPGAVVIDDGAAPLAPKETAPAETADAVKS